MKIFRILLFTIFLLNISCHNIDAQILKRFLKMMGKETVENTTVKGAKNITEDIVTKALRKEFGSRATRKTALLMTETSSEAAERILKTTVYDGMKKVLAVGLKSNIDNIGSKFIGSLSKKSSSELVKNLSSKELKNALNDNMSIGLKKVLKKRVVVETSEVLLKKQVAEILGERAAKEWFEKIVKENIEKKTKLLLADIAKNKQLRNAFKNNPNLLNSYNRAVGSKTIRNDLSMLRYMDSGAGKFYRKGISALNKYGDGSNLLYRDGANGVVEILDNKSGRLLGRMTKDNMGKYVIHVPENGDRTLLNLYPQSNCTYKSGSHTWITDEKGRVVEVHYAVKPVNNTKYVRNSNMDTQMGTWKNMYNSDGRLVGDAPRHMPDDDGGHLIALENGGTSDCINYIPQDKLTNRKGIWREAEKAAKKAAEDGNKVECVIKLHYSNATSLRPASMTRAHKVNGQYQKIKIGKNEYILDGTRKINNPYNYNKTQRSDVLIPLYKTNTTMAA